MSAKLLRIACLLGAGLFAYLSLIPAGLVIATLDPACSGSQCGYSAVGDVIGLIVYGASFLALLGSAACFVLFALRPESAAASERLVRSLAVTATALAAAMFAIFAIGAPIAAAALALVGVALFSALWRHRARSREKAPGDIDASTPESRTNGHGPKLDRLPRV